jgi:hypothetical protein
LIHVALYQATDPTVAGENAAHHGISAPGRAPDTDERAREGKRRVTAHTDGLMSSRTMIARRSPDGSESVIGRLEVQLLSGPDGCVARFFGDLVGKTGMVLWEIGEILRNEASVVLDFSGVTSFDNLGFEAVLGLVDMVRSSGGRATIGCEG